MDLTLNRFHMTPFESVGTLEVPDTSHEVFYTIEQPWKNNLPFHSCVPAGVYVLVPHVSGRLHERDGKTPLHTWALSNPQLNVYAEKGEAPAGARYDCLIHPANWARDVEGCIGPGLGFNGTSMVLSSRDAFEEIRRALGEGTTGHTLTITENDS